MPDDQAKEKSDLLEKLGAEVERVRPAPIVDQNQFVNRARNRAAEHTADPNRRGKFSVFISFAYPTSEAFHS